MDFVQTFAVSAPREKVWDFLWDVEEFAKCIPGVSHVEQIGEERYLAMVERKIGFLKARFRLQIEVEERRAPEFIRVRGTGQDGRIAARLTQTLEVALEAASASETRLALKSRVEVFGRLASLGQSVMKSQADKIFKEFAENMKAKLED